MFGSRICSDLPLHRRDTSRVGASCVSHAAVGVSTNILLTTILAAWRHAHDRAGVLRARRARPAARGTGTASWVRWPNCRRGGSKLKIGSLYGVLDRLAAEGLIEPDREEAHHGRLRRYYRLTRDGRARAGSGGRASAPPPLVSVAGEAGPDRPAQAAGCGERPLERALPAGAAAAARLRTGTVGTGHGRRLPGQLADRRPGGR